MKPPFILLVDRGWGTSDMKRVFDIGVSLAGLLISLPLILLAMLAIRAETPGSPLFTQPRVGRGERTFTCYKLRTMHADTRHLPTHETHASAVTPLGRILRKYKLDELPQLYNVVTGDMSLVGPRPCLPSQRALIEARKRLGVLDVRPGITGLAQVRGIDMSDPERLAAVDAEYVGSASFAGDLRLLIATVLGRGIGMDHVSGKARS
jgi:O-antigen biosynthesis protein WbqP